MSGRFHILENFIVLEGLDGAGTTTRLAKIEEKLRGLGIPNYCTCEPTGGEVGMVIRKVLRGQIELQPRTVAQLFAADRWEHLRKPEVGIIDRLERGELVASDRYLFSSLAYQSVQCGFDFVLGLNREYPLPKYLFYVDTPIALCQERRQGRMHADLFDRTEMQEKVERAYRRAFEYFSDSDMIVEYLDGRLSTEKIFETLWDSIKELPIISL